MQLVHVEKDWCSKCINILIVMWLYESITSWVKKFGDNSWSGFPFIERKPLTRTDKQDAHSEGWTAFLYPLHTRVAADNNIEGSIWWAEDPSQHFLEDVTYLTSWTSRNVFIIIQGTSGLDQHVNIHYDELNSPFQEYIKVLQYKNFS